MYTRTAVFEGRIKDGREEEFFAAVQAELLPYWRRMPHAIEVRLLRTVSSDADARPFAMVQEIDYPSLEAIEEALASPIRTEARAVTERLMAMFEGRFYHLVYQRLAPA